MEENKARANFIKFANQLFDSRWDILNLLSGSGMASAKYFSNKLCGYDLYLFYTSFCLLLISFWRIQVNKKSLNDLEQDNRQLTKQLSETKDKLGLEKTNHENSILDYKQCLNELLRSNVKSIYEKLKFNHMDRISVYQHKDNRFSLLCRVAQNPTFSSPGRPLYPNNKGFIAEGLKKREYEVCKLPSTEKGYDNYIAEVQKKCDIDKEIIEKLSMKSRSYYVLSAENPANQRVEAVVVYESLKSEFDDIKKIKSVAKELNGQIIFYIHQSDSILPDLAFAKEKGL